MVDIIGEMHSILFNPTEHDHYSQEGLANPQNQIG